MAYSSSLVFLVITLFLVSFTLVAEAAPKNRRVLGEEDTLEDIEKQLKAINKPAIKSFTTDHGDIYDCIDIYKQLAFDHPLLKNHTIQALPKVVSSKRNIAPSPFECPQGTVIIKRIMKKDFKSAQKLSLETSGIRQYGHHSAGLGFKGNVTEASGLINVWNPQVVLGQFSQARILVSSQTNSIQAGWQVNPGRNTGTRFYTYWTADGYNKRGCFDMHCPGFVQISRTNPLGTTINAASTRDGKQIYINVIISRDPNTGNWLLYYEDEAIGYWPRELFTAQGLGKEATYASWGGEVYSAFGLKSPSMGSGSFAEEGYARAASVNNIKIRDGLWGLTKPVGDLFLYADRRRCYNAKYVSIPGIVFFGGPGGC